MSEYELPAPKQAVQRSSSDFSNISGFSEKKYVKEIYERNNNPYSEASNQNNPSYVDIRSNMSKSKIKEATSVPVENDTELHIEAKFNNMNTHVTQNFDNPPHDKKIIIVQHPTIRLHSSPSSKSQNTKTMFEEAKSDSLDMESESSESGENKNPQSSKVQSKKIDSLVIESIVNSKSRKSCLVSFGGGNKGQFCTNELEESKRTKQSKTIKEDNEEDEQELNSGPLGQKGEGTEMKSEGGETVKSYRKSKLYKEEQKKTLYNVISDFYLTKKFISLLRNSTFYRRPKWLKDIHFRMINDWSFRQDGWNMLNNEDAGGANQEKNSKACNMFRKFKKGFIKQIKKLGEIVPETFDPTQKFRVCWDLMHLMIIVLNLIITPIEVGFDLKESIMSNTPTIVFVDFSAIFFVVDLIVNMNTAYYDRGTLIFKRSSICKNYLSGPMFRDILSFFSQIVGIYYRNAFTLYCDLFILLRTYNLKKIFRSIEEYIAVDEKLYNTLALFKLIFGVFFLSHILACLWHFVGNNQGDTGPSWLVFYGIEHEHWYIKYLYSYYYVVISMNTVGYGDLVPQTVYERLFTIFFIYFACWMFAYTINSIGMILQDINRMNHDYNRSINLINGYMKQKNISFELQMRIRKYIQFIWQEEKTHSNLETSRVIDKLSKSLRQELLLQANGVILRELPMFNLNFSEETLRKIVYTMKEVSYIPGDPIYFANDTDDKSLYILRSGEVELYVETPRPNDPYTIIKTLTKKGEVFGDYSFFSDKERETCARSSTFTSVFIIRQQDLLDIIKDNPIDYQSYCQVKDQINLYQKFDGIYQKCPICSENMHMNFECPVLHLVLNKSRIIKKHIYSEHQKRVSGRPRKPRKILNALKNFEKHENLAQKLHQHLHSEEDEDEDATSEDQVSVEEPTTTHTKPAEENSTNNDHDDSPKFKDTMIEPQTRPILKAMTLRLTTGVGGAAIQAYNDSKSSLTLPNNEVIDRRPELNQPKFFGEMSLGSPKSKTQIVAFTKEISSESLSMGSNLSKRSKIDGSDPRMFKNNKKKKSYSELSKKVSSSQDDESKQRKSVITPRKGKHEDSGTFDSRTSKKSAKSSSSEKLPHLIKKNEEQKETQIFTTTTENKELQLDDVCKSFENYFVNNNVEKVVELANETNERKRKKKKLSKTTSKLTGVNTSSMVPFSPLTKNKRRGMSRSNFFMKKEDANSKERIELKKKNQNDRRRSIFDKGKIIEFLKEEERKKTQKMGFFAKLKNIVVKAKDEDLLSKYFIKTAASAGLKKKKPEK